MMMFSAIRRATAAGVVAMLLTGPAIGQTPPPMPPLDNPLPGRPDAVADLGDARLGEPFVSQSAGLALRPPYGGIMQRRAGDAEFVRFTSPDASWTFFAQKHTLSEPVVLSQDKPDAPRGMLETAFEQLKRANPNLTVLRNDVTNLGAHSTGILITRYTLGAQTLLNQQAIIQADPQLYYILTYLSPGDRQPDPEQPSLEEARAVGTFQAILDSVQVLDGSKLKDEQDSRLYSTRALFENWTDAKIAGAIVPQQWLRVLRDGKDVGYIYMVQESETSKRPGVRIGIRSRQLDAHGRKVDSESWMFSTSQLGNRYPRNESFSHVTLVQGPKGPEHLTEIGVSDRVDKVVAVGGGFGEKPGAGMSAEYKLQAKYVTHRGDLPTIDRDLPPFYLPQSIAQLMPRLLPIDTPKGYLFASYAGDTREVMLRYVDVGKEKKVSIGGQVVRAIPIQDRLGLEGSITTHYISPEGQFLGSSTVTTSDDKPVTITVLPSDEATLKQLWKDAELTRPSEPTKPAGPVEPNLSPATP